MSIITLSALLDQISGRVGTVVFCRDGVGGPYIRGFGPVFNPQTSFQDTVRNLLTAVAQEWPLLTEANRNSWNVFAKKNKWKNRLAQDTTITGFDWFSKLSFQRLYYNEPSTPFSVIADGPKNLSVKPLTKVLITSTASTSIVVELTPAPAVHATTITGFVLADTIKPGVTKAPRFNFAYSQPNGEDPTLIEYNYDPGRYAPRVVGQRAALGVFRMNTTTGVMTPIIEQIFTWAA